MKILVLAIALAALCAGCANVRTAQSDEAASDPNFPLAADRLPWKPAFTPAGSAAVCQSWMLGEWQYTVLYVHDGGSRGWVLQGYDAQRLGLPGGTVIKDSAAAAAAGIALICSARSRDASASPPDRSHRQAGREAQRNR
ncbi:MAG TPA: hypothetical protein VFX38_04945 [Gammaproteobacteria bacterium]|nr:hypothetical protein [Gammaproteobacteria bacterium]